VEARKTTVVIADDHRLILLVLRAELEAAGFDVRGEATSGADALDRVLESQPDLALLDVNMPEGRGDEVADVLAREAPDVKVVLITAEPNEDGAVNAMRAGALGYIDKAIAPRRLAHVLRDVVNGEGSFPRQYMPRLVREMRHGAAQRAGR
jgi:two-component system nitrate/nitrite response regulator NarL